MSTRGAVAIKNSGGWLGVYNHWDSYPTGLGKELWDYLHQDGLDLEGFAKELLKYDDWRNFRGGGICEYCGKVGLGQPHDISGAICYPSLVGKRKQYDTADQMREHFKQLPAWQGRDDDIEQMIKRELEIKESVERTGYPDPEAQYHQHGQLTDKMTNQNADALFIEWVYVIDPEKRVLEVLAHRQAEGTHTETSYDGKRTWQEPNYEHYLLATYFIDGDEPDWKELENKADQISDTAYKLFGGD